MWIARGGPRLPGAAGGRSGTQEGENEALGVEDVGAIGEARARAIGIHDEGVDGDDDVGVTEKHGAARVAEADAAGPAPGIAGHLQIEAVREGAPQVHELRRTPEPDEVHAQVRLDALEPVADDREDRVVWPPPGREVIQRPERG